MRPKIKLTEKSGRAGVQAALAVETTAEMRERLHTIRLAYTGRYSLDQIAEAVGRARSSVAKYIRQYRAGGLAALRPRRRGGAREERTKIGLAASRALLNGLHRGRWQHAEEIRQWLASRYGVRLKRSGVFSWLRRHHPGPLGWHTVRGRRNGGTTPGRRRVDPAAGSRGRAK